MLGKIKDMYRLQKQAKETKKKLKNIHIESESGEIVVTINGEQEVIEVKLPESVTQREKIQDDLVKAFNKAIKKSQQIAAENMKGVMNDLGLNI